MPIIDRVTRTASRLCFLTGGGLLTVGIHRLVFGVHPKLIWVRDLPWGRVSAPLCFVAALGLAGVGAVLGRRALARAAVRSGDSIGRLDGGSTSMLGASNADVSHPGSRSRAAASLHQPNER